MKKVKTKAGLISLLLVMQSHVFSQKEIPVLLDVQLSEPNTVRISWTKPEQDSLEYVLEKSVDSKRWQTIANINSQVSPCYDYIDLQSKEGINYYRIAQKRNGQLLAVSDVKWIPTVNSNKMPTVNTANSNKLYTWPSPANDILHLRSPFVNGSLDIIGSDGRFVRKIAITDLITDVPLQKLPSGMYFIHLRHGKDILIDKFIKQQSF